MRAFVACLLLLVAVLVMASAAAVQQPAAAPRVVQPKVIEVLREFERVGAQPLWPGFEPTKTAVEVYDGANTYLYHHPKPPPGFTPLAFTPLEGAPGVGVLMDTYMFPGQHDSVRANTGTELNGVPTATADISKSKATVREQAALLIHETFHVYEKKEHPKWAANEAELFTYPMDDAEALALRRLETLALVRALEWRKRNESPCWARKALRIRKQRFALIGPNAAAYERGIELNEGLAQYVEYKSILKTAALTDADFPAELIRQRGYATGQAWALLLDLYAGLWRQRLGRVDARDKVSLAAEQSSLDEYLELRLGQPTGKEARQCVVPQERTARERANREVAELIASRAKRKQDFLSAPGWRIEIVAGKEPLWPQGFDPWNVSNLGDNNILHTRWVKLGNGAGAIEALEHPSLTEGVGPHPLFNGAKRFIITGLAAAPSVSVNAQDGKVTIAVPGAKGTFTGASVTTTGTTVVVRLP